MDTNLGKVTLPLRRVLLCGTLALGMGFAPQSQAIGAQPGDAAPARPAANQAQEDQYAVPEGDATELLDFMMRVQRTRPAGQTREAVIDHVQKVLNAISTAADRVLAAEPTEQQAQAAAELKLQALQQLHQLELEPNLDRANAFLDKLEKDPRESLQNIAKRYRLQTKVLGWEQLNEEQQAQVLADIKTYFQQLKSLDRSSVQMAMSLGMSLERAGNTKAAGDLYSTLEPIFSASDDEAIAEYGEKIGGMARRLQLLGNEMPLEGRLLDGSMLDWKSYRGKVVLVDFWATWCGPCIAELPNVKQNYERYHDRGFEVVAISLDTERQAVEQFVKQHELPWTTLFNDEEAISGWNHPMATRYGIMAIPTAILVDQQGKVVELEARGETLGQQLAKLLGPDAPQAAEE